MTNDGSTRGHPLLATILSVSLQGIGIPPANAAEPDTGLPRTGVREELELIKEEESVSIAVRHEQPISQAPSNVYVITDQDIRQSGAVDIPTVLRRIPGLEVMQTTGADFNVSVRGDNHLTANKLLVMVDGRSIYVDVQGQVVWKLLPSHSQKLSGLK
jgi:iron complex outermembrane receptor protein